jgi:thiamine biosynthesis lipoprotein
LTSPRHIEYFASVNLRTIFICSLLAFAVPSVGAASVADPLAAAREYVMGTIVELRVYTAGEPGRVPLALQAALREIRTIDRLMAVQRPESDVSRVNREGARGPVSVDRRVIEVLEASLAASRTTEGAFDVTVLPVVRAWGFTDGHPARPSKSTVRVAGWRSIVVDVPNGTVSLRDAGAAVDLGGIGKGYALDRARDVLRAHGVTSAWIDIGGEVATLGGAPEGGPWRVGIRHPRRRGEILGVVEIDEGSVSTSGDEVQYVEEGGRRFGHVVDPTTGAPAEGLASATVIGRSAATTDALSTAAVVLGPERAPAILARAGVESVLARDDRDGRLALTVTPNSRFRAAP